MLSNFRWFRRWMGGGLLILSALAWGAPVAAGEVKLVPQTKIRLTVVQWIPTKGVYETWGPLGGEFLVSEKGELSLPVVGIVPVGELDEAGLADEIAGRLKTRIGLVETPETSVEVIEYPPIYVVGDVARPGEYRFRKGLTVLQALALAGGQYRRADGLAGTRGQAELAGELRELEDSILRSTVKLARLEAEMAGAKEFAFKAQADQQGPLATATYDQEKRVFSARAAVVERQSRSFTELRELMAREIDTLESKISGNDEDIESVRKELATVKPMVDKGVILPTRQTDLERALRSYQAARLDMVTAIMRARQNIAEATRNLEGLADNRDVEVATQLQEERGTLKQLQLRRDTRRKLLLDVLADGPTVAEGPAYTVSRRVDDAVSELAAPETMALQPGDVVRVTRGLPRDTTEQPEGPGDTEVSRAQPGEAIQ